MMIVTLASVLLFILLTMDYCQNRQCISTWHARPKIAIHIKFPRDVLHERCCAFPFLLSLRPSSPRAVPVILQHPTRRFVHPPVHDICLQKDRNTQNDWPICCANLCTSGNLLETGMRDEKWQKERVFYLETCAFRESSNLPTWEPRTVASVFMIGCLERTESWSL